MFLAFCNKPALEAAVTKPPISGLNAETTPWAIPLSRTLAIPFKPNNPIDAPLPKKGELYPVDLW